MQTLQLVLGLAAAVPGGILMEMTVRRFLTEKNGWQYKPVPILLFCIVIGMPSWIGDENPLFLFPFFLAVFLLCYTGPWYARLIVGAIFYTLLIPLNMMIDTAFRYSIHPSDIFIVAVKTLPWGIIWLLVRRFVEKELAPVRSGKLWALLGGLSLAPLFATLSMTIWHMSEIEETVYDAVVLRFAYIILPFAFVSASALLAALAVLSRHEELEQQQKLAEIQAVYYQGLKREQSEVRTLRHDLHNHITAAQGLLEHGDVGGVKRYLEELSRSQVLTGSFRICENDVANAVLSSKAAIMQQEDIPADWEINLPKKLDIPDIELCALLGNALDNAIEAVRGARDKQIIVRARADKGILMLRVENAVGGLLRREQGVFKTTKNDRTSHGFGIDSMQSIVQRHGGSLETAVKDGRFELVVYMPVAAHLTTDGVIGAGMPFYRMNGER